MCTCAYIQGVPTSFGWKAFHENLNSARNYSLKIRQSQIEKM